MNALAKVAAAFAIGAIATYLLGDAMLRRRISPSSTDARLREQVRSRLPDLVSFPDAIEVAVEAGIVRVSGRVLSRELGGLLMGLTDIPGVFKVYNALSPLDDPTVPEQ